MNYNSTIEAPPATMDVYYNDSSYKITLEKIKEIGTDLKILDVGCGEGLMGSLLVRDHDVHGVDIHKGKIDRCCEKGINAKLIEPNYILPYQNDVFDVVICSEVLEHLEFPEKLLIEIKRVLVSNGCFIITVPNMYDLNTRIKCLFGRRTKITYGSNLGHIRFFSKESFTDMVGKYFIIEKDVSYRFVHYFGRYLSLFLYILGLIRKPSFKDLVVRKQRLYNQADRILNKLFGFTSWGGGLLIFAKGDK